MTLQESPVTPRSRLAALLPRAPAKRQAHPELARARQLFQSQRVQPIPPPLALTPLGRPEPASRRDPVLALVHRITQGFNLAEYQRARALGYEAYLEEQLDPLSIDDSVMDAKLASYVTLGLSPKELYDTYSLDATVPYYEFKTVAVQRAVHSKRQLFERMCEFWNDHFSMDHNKGDIEWLFMAEHERNVIRPNALGSFPAILSGNAHNAAMLFYLDNWLNSRFAIQENYGRELLELHTLGVYGGYSEVDVKEVAKCFTGWTLNGDYNSGNWLRGFFDNSQHTPGEKLVLGNSIDNFPPRDDAKKVLDILAVHPSTADFLARKLIRWFLTPTPPEYLVSRVVDEYLATNGDIKAMLRVILARENMGLPSLPKFRRPFHYVASLLRTIDADVSDGLYPVFSLAEMGHVPFDHVTPDGYPDTIEAWGSSLLPRWSFASFLFASTAAVTGQPMPGVTIPIGALKTKLEFQTAADRPGLAERIDQRLLGRSLTRGEVLALQGFIDSYPTTFGVVALFEAIALGASLPGSQWY
jgi:uncharacterized protein (DUF1800 family)